MILRTLDGLRHIVKVVTSRADSINSAIVSARQDTVNRFFFLFFFFFLAREEIAGEKCDVAKRAGMSNKQSP